MKRARTDDEPIGDKGKILLIVINGRELPDVYSLDSVTPLVYSYLRTANCAHEEDLDDCWTNVSPLAKALHYLWRAIGDSDDECLCSLPSELQESVKEVRIDAWKKYKTTFEDVNADMQCTISNVFTLNLSEV